jgi:hypothetical protein
MHLLGPGASRQASLVGKRLRMIEVVRERK